MPEYAALGILLSLIHISHMKNAAYDFHEAVTNQTRFVQRSRQHRPVTDTLECNAVVAADSQTDGGIHRNGHAPIPSTGIAIHGIAMAQHIHWKNAMLVKTSQFAERDNSLVRHADHVAQIFAHIYKCDVAAILAIAPVHRSGGKVNANEVVEY